MREKPLIPVGSTDPGKYAEWAATVFNANDPGHFPGRPLFEGLVDRAVEEGMNAERARCMTDVCEHCRSGVPYNDREQCHGTMIQRVCAAEGIRERARTLA